MPCSQELRDAGQPAPRTCPDCGLGPCCNPNAGPKPTLAFARQYEIDHALAVGGPFNCWLTRHPGTDTVVALGVLPNSLRGTGRTARQMMSAPPGAHFVWVNENLHYPIHLARHLKRDDLTIVGRAALTNGRMLGLRLNSIVVDHHLLDQLTPKENIALGMHASMSAVPRTGRL